MELVISLRLSWCSLDSLSPGGGSFSSSLGSEGGIFCSLSLSSDVMVRVPCFPSSPALSDLVGLGSLPLGPLGFLSPGGAMTCFLLIPIASSSVESDGIKVWKPGRSWHFLALCLGDCLVDGSLSFLVLLLGMHSGCN